MKESIHVPPFIPMQLPTKIAFVGEAPSDEEVAKRTPFVGPSGAVFNQIMRSAGLERTEYLITNVFDQKAPDNDVTAWFSDPVRMAESTSRLQEELANASPNVIVPLGGSALYAFTGHDKITNFRGAVFPADRILPGAKLVPTFHPSKVMRQWKLLSVAVGDVVKAAAEADRGPEIIYPRKELLVEPTFADVEAFAVECKSSPRLAVDIETGWGQITCIGFAPTPDRAMCIPFTDRRKNHASYWPTASEEYRVWQIVRGICEAPNPKVLQNGYYDAQWLWRYLPRIAIRNYRHDIRLMHHNLYPELSKDLASMAATYTQIGAYKHMGGRYKQEKRDA
jgi:uracil-DNA glycosylase family 4